MAALLHHQCLPEHELQDYQHSQELQQHSQVQQVLVEANATVFTMQDEDPSEVLGRIEAELLSILRGLREGHVEMSVVTSLCIWPF